MFIVFIGERYWEEEFNRLVCLGKREVGSLKYKYKGICVLNGKFVDEYCLGVVLWDFFGVLFLFIWLVKIMESRSF